MLLILSNIVVKVPHQPGWKHQQQLLFDRLRPPAAAAAGAALGLEGAERRLGGASVQHGVAVAAVRALAGGPRLRRRRWRRFKAAPQPGTPHLQHLVEHRQQQDHQHGQRHPW